MIPRGRYKLVRSAALSSAVTLLQIKVPTTTMIEIVRFELTVQTVTSATGHFQLLKKAAAATVSAQSPLVVGVNYPASLCVSGTSATGITASAEGTDGVVAFERDFNSINGYLHLPTPEERDGIAPGEIFAAKITTLAASGSVYTAELEWLEY